MFLFYGVREEDGLYLKDDDHRHAIKVLRKKAGDAIYCTDGRGNKYKCLIEEIKKDHSLLQIVEQSEVPQKYAQLHIAITPTKNSQRLEWFLEKATEIGINRISIINTKRTEKKSFKKERAERIVISAMKQSLRYNKPQLDEIMSLTAFVDSLTDDHKRFVAHYTENNEQLKDVLEGNSLIVIGPEGDFTEDEINYLTENGFATVNLGDHRLRTETAGLVACQTFNLISK